jgi:hypothetical protein
MVQLNPFLIWHGNCQGDGMPPKPPQNPTEKSALKTAAIAIGELAGKTVAAAESVLPHKRATAPPAPPAPKAAGKLPPKHKTRVPRRQKKMLARAAKTPSAAS